MADMAQRVREYITRADYRPLRAKELAKSLGFKKQRLRELDELLSEWRAGGLVTFTESGRIVSTERAPKGAARGARTLQGVLKRTAGGDGFVLPHGAMAGTRDAEVYVPAAMLGDAQSGDTVLVELTPTRGTKGRRNGRVLEVVERATTTFVGSYFEEDEQAWVQIDGVQFHDPVWVGDPGAKGARPGDKVVIDIARFPAPHRTGEAVVTEVLGPRGQPGVDTLTIIHEFGLPDAFPPEVLADARRAAEQFDEDRLEGREDLTGETIVTIDPADARDFDDAISLKRSESGHWLLGVHIADVSAFVPQGSALDKEARRRGNSVYLPTRVLPMLPELISNGLASLQEKKLRWTVSAFIEFTADGVPVHARFARTAIKTARRFAYEQVMPIVEHPEKAAGVPARVRALLVDMHTLAMILRKRRMSRGALNLQMAEVELEFDRDGRVTGAHEEHHDASHEVIEEFMLAANIAVARWIAGRGQELLRRVHDEPSEIKLRALGEFAAAIGYPLKRVESHRDLQALLERVRGKPEERALNYALLRSLKQAVYSPEPLGHYALAEEHYCHFTSPIRRYPDLVIHRQLLALLAGASQGGSPRGGELALLGQHCSDTERRAAEAERELKKLKLLSCLEDRIGEELRATITGVPRNGLFCRGVELPAEGFVPIATLRNDLYDYDRDAHCLVGRRSGETYRLGDDAVVRVAQVDVDRREMTLKLVSHGGRPAAVDRGARQQNRTGNRKGERSPASGAPQRRRGANHGGSTSAKGQPNRGGARRGDGGGGSQKSGSGAGKQRGSRDRTGSVRDETRGRPPREDGPRDDQGRRGRRRRKR